MKNLTNISILCPYSSSLTDPRAEWLERLSRMEQLHVLQFDASRIQETSLSQLNLGQFSALQSINVIGSLPSLLTVFSSFRTCTLQDVRVTFDDAPMGPAEGLMKKLIEVITASSGNTLTVFSFESDTPFFQLAAHTAPLIDIIRPLTLAHSLKEVLIHLPTPHAVTDQDASTFAESWPLLESRTIKMPPGSIRPKVSMLVEFAIRCPSLRVLHLPTNFDNLPDPETIPLTRHGLRSLYCGELNIRTKYVKEVARIIHRLFPGIDPSLSGESRWGATLEHVKMLQRPQWSL